MKRETLIGVLLLAFLISAGCSSTRKEVVEEGKVSVYENDELIAELTEKWEKTYLTATGRAPVPPGYKTSDGVGRDLARDHALLEARSNLLSQLGEVYITENISVLNGAVKSHRTSEMEGTIAGAEVIEDRWDDDGENYVVSIQLAQVRLVGYIREWIEGGIVDPEELDRYMIRPKRTP